MTSSFSCPDKLRGSLTELCDEIARCLKDEEAAVRVDASLARGMLGPALFLHLYGRSLGGSRDCLAARGLVTESLDYVHENKGVLLSPMKGICGLAIVAEQVLGSDAAELVADVDSLVI